MRPPCKCRRAGSAPPWAEAQSSSAASHSPAPVFSPRAPGGLRTPTTASGPAPGAAHGSPAWTRGTAPLATSLPPVPTAPPRFPPAELRLRCRHLGSGQRRKRQPSTRWQAAGAVPTAPWRRAVRADGQEVGSCVRVRPSSDTAVVYLGAAFPTLLMHVRCYIKVELAGERHSACPDVETGCREGGGPMGRRPLLAGQWLVQAAGFLHRGR